MLIILSALLGILCFALGGLYLWGRGILPFLPDTRENQRRMARIFLLMGLCFLVFAWAFALWVPLLSYPAAGLGICVAAFALLHLSRGRKAQKTKEKLPRCSSSDEKAGTTYAKAAIQDGPPP